MTVIRPNSISGVTSITAQGGEISYFKSDGTRGNQFTHNIHSTGVITATSFVGSGTALTGIDASTIKFGNDVIWLTNLSSMWFGPYYSMSNNKENKKKFIDSSLLQNYLYQGDDDSNLISYFQKFIYLDTDTQEEIKLHKKVSFDDLEF